MSFIFTTLWSNIIDCLQGALNKCLLSSSEFLFLILKKAIKLPHLMSQTELGLLPSLLACLVSFQTCSSQCSFISNKWQFHFSSCSSQKSSVPTLTPLSLSPTSSYLANSVGSTFKTDSEINLLSSPMFLVWLKLPSSLAWIISVTS